MKLPQIPKEKNDNLYSIYKKQKSLQTSPVIIIQHKGIGNSTGCFFNIILRIQVVLLSNGN